MIPVSVVDFGDNQDIIDCIEAHASLITPGDVTTSWGIMPICPIRRPEELLLKIDFLQPMEATFAIRFSIEKGYNLIDGIMQSKALYLVADKQGQKISQIFMRAENKGKKIKNAILIDVPDTGAKAKWEEIFLKALSKKYQKLGVSKNESQNMATELIKSMRELWKFRKQKQDTILAQKVP